MSKDEIYNPLDKKHLGESVAIALLQRELIELSAIEPFDGAGIYAIYYVGDFEPYTPMAFGNRNGQFDFPVYVGKAIPPGARKGEFGLEVEAGLAPGQIRLSAHLEG